MRAVTTKHGTGKQSKPVSTQAAKQQQPEMESRPASDDQDLPVRSIGKPVASKFKIAALYVASGPTGFLIPSAQAVAKCLQHAAACTRRAFAAGTESGDSDVRVESSSSSEDSKVQDKDSSETASSWSASSMPDAGPEEKKQLASESDTSETASSMPDSEPEEKQQLASESDSSETASSMPDSDNDEDNVAVQPKTEAPTRGRKLDRRHVRTASQTGQPTDPGQNVATAVQNLVTQDQ